MLYNTQPLMNPHLVNATLLATGGILLEFFSKQMHNSTIKKMTEIFSHTIQTLPLSGGTFCAGKHVMKQYNPLVAGIYFGISATILLAPIINGCIEENPTQTKKFTIALNEIATDISKFMNTFFLMSWIYETSHSYSTAITIGGLNATMIWLASKKIVLYVNAVHVY